MTAAVPALAPADFPRVGDIRVDVGFLVAALVAAVFVGASAGTLPALRYSRVALAPSMQAGGARVAAMGNAASSSASAPRSERPAADSSASCCVKA